MTYSDREFGASQSDYEPKEQQMSDIVERLQTCTLFEEATIEIKRLRAGRAAVVEECRQAAETAARKWPHAANDVVAAIAALKGGAA